MPKRRRKQAEERLREIGAFLLGEGQLDGRWFGDDPPTTPSGRPRVYWWRVQLRSALADLIGQPEPLEAMSKRLAGTR